MTLSTKRISRRPSRHNAATSSAVPPPEALVPTVIDSGPGPAVLSPTAAPPPAASLVAVPTSVGTTVISETANLVDLDDSLDDFSLSISPIDASSQDNEWEDIAPGPANTVDSVGATDNTTTSTEASGLISGIGYTSISPLALSMLNAVDSSLMPGRDLMASINPSGPRSTSKMPDNAKYWVDKDNEVLVVRFPCLVDTGVLGVKTGKYFDLYGEDITDDKFKKLRAIFGFRSLLDDPDTYPAEVLRAASSAQKLLYKLQAKNEVVALEHQEEYPSNVKGFFKADAASDCFQYLIRSDPIFTPALDPTGTGSISVIDLTGDDSSADDHIFSTPSKLRARAALKTASVSSGGGSGSLEMSKRRKSSNEYTLGDWAKPRHAFSRYSYYIGDRTHLWASKFNLPEIRDRNGVLIHPTKWDETLTHLTLVTVDVILKLWDIPPSRVQRREGSRIYQMVLRRIQVHPSNSFSGNKIKTPSTPSSKGKKHANEARIGDEEYAAGPPSPTKKSKAYIQPAATGEEDFDMGA